MGNSSILMEHNKEPFEEVLGILIDEQIAVYQATTGSGKSYIGLELIAYTNYNALIVVPKDDIGYQWSKLLFKYNLKASILTYAAFSKLSKKQLNEFIKNYDLFIFDEAHHIGAQVWTINFNILKDTILGSENDKYILGLTADITRYSDACINVAIKYFNSNLVEGITLSEAINKGIIPSFNYISSLFNAMTEYEYWKNREDDFPESKIDIVKSVLNDLKLHTENIAEIKYTMMSHVNLKEKHKILVFANNINNIEDCHKIFAEFLDSRNFYDIHSKQSKETNHKNIDLFTESKETAVLFSVNKLIEGLHIKDIDIVVMLRKTATPSVFKQILGRLIYATNDHKNLYVFDFVGNNNNLKIYTHKQKISRIHNYISSINSKIENKDHEIIISDYIEDINIIIEKLEDLYLDCWTDVELAQLKDLVESGSEIKDFTIKGRTATACKAKARKMGYVSPNARSKWELWELGIIRANYPELSIKTQELLPHRTIKAIQAKAVDLGIFTENHWSDFSLDFLRANYSLYGAEFCAEKLGKSKGAVVQKAARLGLKSGIKTKAWTQEENAVLYKRFPNEGEECFKDEILKDRTYDACVQQVRKLNLEYVSKRNLVKWTNEDIQYMKKYYPILGKLCFKKFAPKSETACYAFKNQLGLEYNGPRGPKDEIFKLPLEDLEILIEYYPKEGTKCFNRLKAYAIGLLKEQVRILKLKQDDAGEMSFF